MNKGDEFPAFPELLLRLEMHRKCKQTHKIMADYAECVKEHHLGWGGGVERQRKPLGRNALSGVT